MDDFYDRPAVLQTQNGNPVIIMPYVGGRTFCRSLQETGCTGFFEKIARDLRVNARYLDQQL
jgi:hypothetical protein